MQVGHYEPYERDIRRATLITRSVCNLDENTKILKEEIPMMFGRFTKELKKY